jgi:hypothetical protein
MRLWSIHPKYLDQKGLVALWREALLAQAVLAGKTKGYKNHPQLLRFKSQKNQLEAIGAYLAEVKKEAGRRGYRFSSMKIMALPARKPRIMLSSGQLGYEMRHLRKKLALRNRAHLKMMAGVKRAEAHPVFAVKAGRVEAWECRK